MNPQPALPGLDRAATLTERQAFALDVITRLGPLSSEELGARLHAWRAERGGRGHGSDERCQWCPSEGASAGRMLAGKGLVKRRRGEGWVPAAYETPREPSAQLGADEPWPKDFF